MRSELAGPDASRRRAILAAVMLGSILGPIDASVVNVVLPTIARSFSASLAAAQWVPMLYLVTAGSLILFFGRLGDLWGYRRVFLAGLLGFVAASVLCAAAPTMHALVGFRALQGLAAGMMSSVPLAILTGTYPAADRGRVIGLFAGSISVGLAVGPSLGGFLAAAFGWRAVFLVNLPVGLAAFAFRCGGRAGRRFRRARRGRPRRTRAPPQPCRRARRAQKRHPRQRPRVLVVHVTADDAAPPGDRLRRRRARHDRPAPSMRAVPSSPLKPEWRRHVLPERTHRHAARDGRRRRADNRRRCREEEPAGPRHPRRARRSSAARPTRLPVRRRNAEQWRRDENVRDEARAVRQQSSSGASSLAVVPRAGTSAPSGAGRSAAPRHRDGDNRLRQAREVEEAVVSPPPTWKPAVHLAHPPRPSAPRPAPDLLRDGVSALFDGLTSRRARWEGAPQPFASRSRRDSLLTPRPPPRTLHP